MHLHRGQEHAAHMSCEMGKLIYDMLIKRGIYSKQIPERLKGSLGQTYGSFIIHDEPGTVRTNTWIIFAYFCLVRCYTVILLYDIILNIMTSQF